MSFSCMSSLAKYAKVSSGGSGSSAAYTALLASKPPWAQYNASSYNSSTKTLTDLTGNGRNATASTNVTVGSGSGNGASASISYLSGTASDYLIFPAGSIPANFTICEITRYTTATKNRILQSTNSAWLIGFYNGGTTCYFGSGFNATNVTATNNWSLCCANNSNSYPGCVLIDNVARGQNAGSSGNLQLCINYPGTAETSPWSFNQCIIWNQILTNAELAIVSQAMWNSLSTGVNG